MFTQSGFLKTNFAIHGEENRTQRTCTIFMKALFSSALQTEDPGSIPELESSPGAGSGYSL